MKTYLDSIGQFPLLTREEETALAKTMKEAPTETERQEARETLINSNLRLVVSIAKYYKQNCNLSIDDLISEGNMGLMKAVDKYENEKDCRVSTYASHWIRGSIKCLIKRETGKECISLDVENEKGETLHETLEDTRETETETMIKTEHLAYIKSLLDTLPKDERKLIRMRYGIGCKKRKTLVEVGKAFGVTNEAVRLRQMSIEKKLKGRISNG